MAGGGERRQCGGHGEHDLPGDREHHGGPGAANGPGARQVAAEGDGPQYHQDGAEHAAGQVLGQVGGGADESVPAVGVVDRVGLRVV